MFILRFGGGSACDGGYVRGRHQDWFRVAASRADVGQATGEHSAYVAEVVAPGPHRYFVVAVG
jgi:hypothetical protein